MDATLVVDAPPPLPVPGSPAVGTSGSSMEMPITTIAEENAPPGGHAERRMSTISCVTAKSGRKRAVYRETPSGDAGGTKSRMDGTKSRMATPSGLVTEVSLARRMTRDSTITESTKSSSAPSRPATVDIESSDLDTVLGDEESLGRRLASLQDIDALSRDIYLRKCQEMGIVPISIVMRKIGDTELNIRNRQCGPMGARAIAVPLVYNRSIVTLDMSCNIIEDEGIRPLCDCLANHISLRDLRLSDNHLTVEGLKEIGRLVLTNRNITDLDISGNHFGDASSKVLQKIIEETRTLKYLDLSNNNLGIEAGIHLGQAIGANDSLEELRLCWNHIRRDGAKALTDGLRENVRLRRLDLSWNGFGQETAECLSRCFAENEGLVDLDLAGNRLNDESMIMLAKGLQHNERLEKLVLMKNPITNVGAFALLAALKENENSALQLIDLRDVSVRDDFLALLTDVQAEHQLEVLYNALSLRAHILNPMDVLITHIMDKGMDVLNTFNVIAISEDMPPIHTEKSEFIKQLKNAGVPLSHSQITQLANGLIDEDSGLVNLSDIMDAANDLQAETASAATSATFDGLSDVMDDSSVAPSGETPASVSEPVKSTGQPPRRPARKERSPIQAGQQYSW